MLLYSALMPLAISIVGVVFLQPHAVPLACPSQRWASWCWACMGWSLGRSIGTRLASRWRNHLAAPRAGHCLPGHAGPGTCTDGVGPGVPGHCRTGDFGGDAGGRSHDLAARPRRATILSVDSLVFRLLWAVVEAGLGVLGDAYGLPTAFLVLGIGSGISLLVVLTLWGRLPRASSA